RNEFTATLLSSSKVLAAGGLATGTDLASCEIYDPSTGHWNSTASMAGARYGHTATLLSSGKVLVTGGNDGTALSSCEIYDPSTGHWNSTASMIGARFQHTATLFSSGQVLAAGGERPPVDLATCEIYNP
ncbi:unnamed protein product, partial [Didymodactylos carnosus]